MKKRFTRNSGILNGDRDVDKLLFLTLTVGAGIYASYLVFKTVALKVAKSV